MLSAPSPAPQCLPVPPTPRSQACWSGSPRASGRARCSQLTPSQGAADSAGSVRDPVQMVPSGKAIDAVTPPARHTRTPPIPLPAGSHFTPAIRNPQFGGGGWGGRRLPSQDLRSPSLTPPGVRKEPLAGGGSASAGGPSNKGIAPAAFLLAREQVTRALPDEILQALFAGIPPQDRAGHGGQQHWTRGRRRTPACRASSAPPSASLPPWRVILLVRAGSLALSLRLPVQEVLPRVSFCFPEPLSRAPRARLASPSASSFPAWWKCQGRKCLRA